jgi:tetrapyrrole methylase family protein/MazG family protein
MKKILIGGMGTASIEHMTLKTYQAILTAQKVFMRTAVHKSAKEISKMRPDIISFDEIYTKSNNFEEVYEKISNEVIAASYENDIIYLVPGSPVFAESTIKLIIEKAEQNHIEVEILPAVSFVDAIFSSIKKDAAHSVKLLDALELNIDDFDKNCVILICQIYDNFIASEIKLKMMEYYDKNKIIYIIHNGGETDAKIIKTVLYELDRDFEFDHMSSLLIPKDETLNLRDYRTLEEVMCRLRGQNGCNWDKQQTHSSLKRYLIEECYEVLDAIEKNDSGMLEEELGDVLLQVYFHATIAKEEEDFDLRDVFETINKKMINRHPHVFKANQNFSPEKVESEWEAIKLKEKGYSTCSESLQSMPKQFPALMYAARVQDKAKKAGFDFENIDQVYDKLKEEVGEFIEAASTMGLKELKEELGDLLFSIVNVSRFLKLDCEDALRQATMKFIDRFSIVEEMVLSDGLNLKEINLKKADEYWNLSKIILKEKYKNEKK